VLIEVRLEPIQRPGSEGQTERLGVGQGGGEDLGDLLGRVGGRPPRSGLIGQGGGPLGVEPLDPGVDRGARDAEVACDGRGPSALGGGQDDPGALDQAGLDDAGAGEIFDVLPLLS
jgi:hypothetical protein